MTKNLTIHPKYSIQMVPHLFTFIYLYGFDTLICTHAPITWGTGSTGLWQMLFTLSKIPELIDTVFLVVRGKEVSFLQWYHHATVLLVTWHLTVQMETAGIVFAAMNYAVHAVMYFYYFLTSCGFRPFWGKYLTYMQLSQMFVGMYTVGYHTWLGWTEKTCVVDWSSVVASSLM